MMDKKHNPPWECYKFSSLKHNYPRDKLSDGESDSSI